MVAKSRFYWALEMFFLVATFVLNVLISGLGLSSWWWGALAGAVVWVGMGATGTLTYSIFNGPPLGVEPTRGSPLTRF